LGILLGAALTYAWVSGQIQSAYQAGYSAGYSAGAAAAPVTPVQLDISAADTQFNFSDYVASDGSATNTSAEITVTIKNVDDEAANVVVTLKNPATGKEGLPDALENSYFNVYAGGLYKKYLFIDGEYTSGMAITVDSDSVVTITIGCELEDAPAGTFADGQTYTMTVFFYQSAANYADSLDFSILT